MHGPLDTAILASTARNPERSILLGPTRSGSSWRLIGVVRLLSTHCAGPAVGRLTAGRAVAWASSGEQPIFDVCRTVNFFGLFFLEALPMAAKAAHLELRHFLCAVFFSFFSIFEFSFKYVVEFFRTSFCRPDLNAQGLACGTCRDWVSHRRRCNWCFLVVISGRASQRRSESLCRRTPAPLPESVRGLQGSAHTDSSSSGGSSL